MANFSYLFPATYLPSNQPPPMPSLITRNVAMETWEETDTDIWHKKERSAANDKKQLKASFDLFPPKPAPPSPPSAEPGPPLDRQRPTGGHARGGGTLSATEDLGHQMESR